MIVSDIHVPAPRTCRRATIPHSFAREKAKAGLNTVLVARIMRAGLSSDPEGGTAAAEFELVCGELRGRSYLRHDGSLVLPEAMLSPAMRSAAAARIAAVLAQVIR